MITITRRELLAAPLLPLPALALALPQPEPIGSWRAETGDTPIANATWYDAREGDGLSFRFTPGFLAGFHSLVSDMLLDGSTLVVFLITLQEGEQGRKFTFRFAGLNQCSFRMRLDLSLTDQNRWQSGREGAFLKPMAGGDRVDLAKVDRLTFTVSRTAGDAARLCMTPLSPSRTAVARLEKPVLPKGPLLDELGQSTIHRWPGKTRGVGQLVDRLRAQSRTASEQKWPSTFSAWGGWKAKRLTEAKGFFRTHHDGSRWWLADPDGYAFFSAGADCVRPDCEARIDGLESALTWMPDPEGEFAAMYAAGRGAKLANYLVANFIRAFGKEQWHEKWAQVALAELRRLRFNTVANWSEYGEAAKARFPYVRPLSFAGRQTPMIYRDFPDVFHASFEADAAAYAAQLQATAKDPALIGYFLMNEPTWGFSKELPAAGMLFTTEECATRSELVRFLKAKYPDEQALAWAWKTPLSWAKLERGKLRMALPTQAAPDLEAFTVKMVERYFTTLSTACKKADPNHLNLGMRWAGVPPAWAVAGMKTFDVFSLNCYMEKLPRATSEQIGKLLGQPVMVGEWHFGALDAGLPASGIGRLENQTERAKAYRVYFEDAAANPNCVGVHWFTLYDQSALGRFDGENYNIGFLDICHRPYPELSQGAIASHERMYAVGSAAAQAYEAEVKYLPKLFL
ncbi:MAG: hypothetical protein JST93_16170 [Acidobacteria bacterium]|nr:hypothetical protein [Acidobacteriota bacterium]